MQNEKKEKQKKFFKPSGTSKVAGSVRKTKCKKLN